MRHIPAILLYSRPLAIGWLIYLAVNNQVNNPLVIGIILITLLADIFDGILARKFNVSTTTFRVLDTVFDLCFYSAVLFYIYRTNPTIVLDNGWGLVVIGCIEATLYATSLWRFGRLPSPHAFMSKCWGLYLIVEFILILTHVPGNHFTVALGFGVLVHLERVLIYTLLPMWEHDIPTVYHAWQRRQGQAIVRHPLLNG
jgi:CDP-diacylglycerol---glycerol-3-phosphate 3-phosphatidyltransferase